MMTKNRFLTPTRTLTAAVSVAAILVVTAAPTQAQPSTSPTTQRTPTSGATGMPAQGMERGRQMQDMRQEMMRTERGTPPCPPGGQTALGGQTASGDQTAGRAGNCK